MPDHANGGSVAVRQLMAAFPLEADPELAPDDAVRLYRVGPLYYAWGAFANVLWTWMESGTFWHEMTPERHRIAFHRSRLEEVVNLCLDRGYAVEVV